ARLSSTFQFDFWEEIVRIAVVEDNAMLADGIARAFRNEGHGVDQLPDAATATDFIKQEDIDLVILDINLPDRSGLDVLRDVREFKNDLPILLLTARDSIEDKVAGLDRGADDYMTKPFELPELQARVRALLRRASTSVSQQLVCGNVIFDPLTRQLSVDDKPIDVPRREASLAELFILKQNQVISKQQIMDYLYGTGSDAEESSVELYVCRLRKRLVESAVVIKTMRGIGYCMRPAL
ncbi:MAG: response regulator transcription factor, partial [Pseudomonadota bacterium]